MTKNPSPPETGSRPLAWLGAPSPGGLALPSAKPAADTLYAPRGVAAGNGVLVAADSGNHRILIWHGLPDGDGRPADVVLGQPDMASEGAAAGGRGPENGLHLPTGVLLVDGALLVADAWHHRVLIWSSVPQRPDTPPDGVIGQDSLSAVAPNRGGACGAATLYWPYGLGWSGGWLHVCDTGNRRVLGWRGLPDGRAPDLVLGQPTPAAAEENRGAAPGPDSFRWPHDVDGDGATLVVADAGNHRVLGWAGYPRADGPAAFALGQPDRSSTREWPYGPQGAAALRFPYALSVDAGRLAVADTANNRVLLWDALPAADGAAADVVFGQPDFDANGENRWDAVTHDSLCWPYGISLRDDVLAVADSGNNRIMLWRVCAAAGEGAGAGFHRAGPLAA